MENLCVVGGKALLMVVRIEQSDDINSQLDGVKLSVSMLVAPGIISV